MAIDGSIGPPVVWIVKLTVCLGVSSVTVMAIVKLDELKLVGTTAVETGENVGGSGKLTPVDA